MAKRGTLDHPKTKRLGRALNMPAWAALGLLEAVWHWVSRYCPEGLLGDEDLEDCADTIRFDAGGKMLAETLESCGLMDAQDGMWYVHDWHDHADETTKKALEKAGKGFANGSQSRRFTKKPEQVIPYEEFANDSREIHEPNATAKPSLTLPINNPLPLQEGEDKEKPKGRATRAKRTWAMVRDEMIEALPQHKKNFEVWFKYRADYPGTVWKPQTVALNIEDFKDWSPDRLKEAIRYSIKAPYTKICEPFKSSMNSGQNGQANGKPATPVLTAEEAGRINSGEGLPDYGSPVRANHEARRQN